MQRRLQHCVLVVVVFAVDARGEQPVAHRQRFYPEGVARGQIGQLQEFDIVALVIEQRALVGGHGHGVVTDPQRQRSGRAGDAGQRSLELDPASAPGHGTGRHPASIPDTPDFDDAAIAQRQSARLQLRIARIDGEPFDDKGRSAQAAHRTEQGDRRVGFKPTAQIVSGVDVVGDDNAVLQATFHRHAQARAQCTVGQITQIGRARVDRLQTDSEFETLKRLYRAVNLDLVRIVIRFHARGAQAAVRVSITGHLKRRARGEGAEANAFKNGAGPFHDNRLAQNGEPGRAVVGIAFDGAHRAFQRRRDVDARGFAAFAILGHCALDPDRHAGTEIVFPGRFPVDGNLGVVDIEAHAVDKNAAGAVDGARTGQTRADDALAAAGATAAGVDDSSDAPAAAPAAAGLQAEQAAGGEQAKGGTLKFWIEALFHDTGSSRNVLS